MFRRILTGVALTLTSGVAVSIALTPSSAPAGASPPAAVQQCKSGGWQSLTNASGLPFRNQGQCISFAIHHPVGLADIAGSFTGTTSDIFPGNCSIVEATFDASYPGSASVGTVGVQLDGCFSFTTTTETYNGTFTFTTSVGSVSGTVSGALTGSPPAPADIELTLLVSSGSGAFATTTGSLHISMQWAGIPSTVVTGSVIVP